MSDNPKTIDLSRENFAEMVETIHRNTLSDQPIERTCERLGVKPENLGLKSGPEPEVFLFGGMLDAYFQSKKDGEQ